MVTTTSTGFTALLRQSKSARCVTRSSRAYATAHPDADHQSKPYETIPKKTGWLPSWFGLIASGGPAYLHEHCDKRHRELGPIFREQLGPNELVFIADTKMIQTTIANEGSRPLPNIPEAWLLYNQVKSVDRGLFFQNGESWHKLRATFNKILLSSDNIVRFGRDVLQINSDLMDTWRLRHNNSTNFVLNDLRSDLCKWSFESTCFMLFGERLNSIQRPTASRGAQATRKADELVQNIANMFTETSNFQVLPAKLAHRLNLRTWKRFEAASDSMLKIAGQYANDYITKVKQQQVSSGGSPSLLKDLLRMNTLNDEEISRSIIDLIIASADTTANALQWMFYLIGKHKSVQERLLVEAKELLAESGDSSNVFSAAPYIRAFMKEAMRLYPTAPFLARTLDHEITLGGYRIPPGVPIVLSLYTTSRMDKYFEQPLEFKPERWLRVDTDCPRRNTNRAHASLPFGHGSRKCIGYKLAEFEMGLLIASFVEAYESSIVNNDDIKIRLRMTLSPDRPVSLRLIAR